MSELDRESERKNDNDPNGRETEDRLSQSALRSAYFQKRPITREKKSPLIINEREESGVRLSDEVPLTEERISASIAARNFFGYQGIRMLES